MQPPVSRSVATTQRSWSAEWIYAMHCTAVSVRATRISKRRATAKQTFSRSFAGAHVTCHFRPNATEYDRLQNLFCSRHRDRFSSSKLVTCVELCWVGVGEESRVAARRDGAMDGKYSSANAVIGSGVSTAPLRGSRRFDEKTNEPAGGGSAITIQPAAGAGGAPITPSSKQPAVVVFGSGGGGPPVTPKFGSQPAPTGSGSSPAPGTGEPPRSARRSARGYVQLSSAKAAAVLNNKLLSPAAGGAAGAAGATGGAGGANSNPYALSAEMGHRFKTLLEESVERLQLLGLITADASRRRDVMSSQSKANRKDIFSLLLNQRQLEEAYAQLMTKKNMLRGLSNKSKLAQVMVCVVLSYIVLRPDQTRPSGRTDPPPDLI